MKQWKRALCGALAVLIFGSAFTGCGKDPETVVDKKVVTLPPEEQILTDTYKQNPEITEYMMYTSNFATYIKNPGQHNETRDVMSWKLFEVNTIQIDCMDLIYLGKSRMGDITANVDKANEDAKNHAIESVRGARQKLLDEEYEAEKAKALEKGKAFNKQRPVADVSDLKYENPYRYVLAYTNPDKKTQAQFPYIWDEYQGKKLIDPAVDKILHLFIYKYDVPYVQCTFESINGKPTYSSSYGSSSAEDTKVRLYNNLIDQEQDWVLTAIAPADCTFLVNQELAIQEGYVLPSYIDVDSRSKGAKNNMVTNGNIKFGGEGFTWDSLMTLCKALDLTMKDKNGKSWRAKTTYVSNERACTYEQTSDTQFTYYTIYLPINQLFKQRNNDLVCPIATIKVTFDKLTNNCVNWTIDYGRFYHSFPAETTHTQGELTVPVNVRQHKIDTTDYKGMLITVDDWIKQKIEEQQINAEFGYYFVDASGVVVGKIDNGLKNYQIEIAVDGEKYYCVKPPVSLNEMKAYYISQSERDKLAEAGTLDSQEEVNKAAKLYYILCMAVTTDEKGRSYPLGYFNNTGALVDAQNQPAGYYIHSIEYDAQVGYKDAVIINEEIYKALLEMYIRTFRLSTSMQDNLETLYLEKDPWRMYQYMTKYVQQNLEQRDKIEAEIGESIDEITKEPGVQIEAKQGILDIIEIEK